MSNDITIIYGIVLFLMLTGFLIPFINEDFIEPLGGNNYTSSVDGEALLGDINPQPITCIQFWNSLASQYNVTAPVTENESIAAGMPDCPNFIKYSPVPTGADKTSIWTALASMFSMLVWSFGGIPFWLELLLFVPLRIVLVLLIVRNIWIGGGG